VTEADLPVLFEHQLDPEATAMAAFPSRDHDSFMTHWRTNVLGDRTVIVKAVVVAGVVAGNIVSWLDGDDRLLGYWIGRQFWGRGIATRALRAFLVEVQARPLQAWVAKHNTGSIRVLEKCGFVVSGEDEVEVDGQRIEEFLFRLDW
jgi:RimJ/RimL family protein N-acetyltransferase